MALQVEMSLQGFSNPEPRCLEVLPQATQTTEDPLQDKEDHQDREHQDKEDHQEDREVHHQAIHRIEVHLPAILLTEAHHLLETTCSETQIHFKND